MKTKKKANTKVSVKKSVLTCEVNGIAFHAEGTQEEVTRKFDEFLGKIFAPLKAGLKQLEG